MKYFETSAKNNTRIKEGFSYIANEIYDIVEFKYDNNIMIKNEVDKNNSKCVGNKNKRK